MDDSGIIRLYLARDQAAVAETAHAYGGFCMSIAMNVLSHREDAEECVNDVYHEAWNSIPPEQPRSLRAFLGRLTRCISISRFRALHAQKRYSGLEQLLSELEDCIPDCASEVERVSDNARVSAAITVWLERLSSDDRALFIRRYWFGNAVKTLAAECGCTPAQMAQRMLRLRRSLRAELEKEGIEI